MEAIVLTLLGLLVLGVLWLIFTVMRARDREAFLQSQMEAMRLDIASAMRSNLDSVASQLNSVTSQVNERLSGVTAQLGSTTGQISDRMDNAAAVVGEVRQRLGELSRATERIFEVGKDISGLEELLRSPKLRGGLGEFLLADLLSQCLPAEHYGLQHQFSSGTRVDAIIRLKGGIVPIDSKFPLENFRKTLAAGSDAEKKTAMKRFAADCRRHIDAIAGSYIRPEDGTLNFALMYVPAENVYYEMILKDDEAGQDGSLSSYAFSKRVVPVSPNSLYVYLQTILLGLKGMEVGEKARHIIARIEGLHNSFEKVAGEFETLGRHLTNSKTRYDEVERKMAAFSDRLSSIAATDDQIAEADVIAEKP